MQHVDGALLRFGSLVNLLNLMGLNNHVRFAYWHWVRFDRRVYKTICSCSPKLGHNRVVASTFTIFCWECRLAASFPKRTRQLGSDIQPVLVVGAPRDLSDFCFESDFCSYSP
jgi:hypothetical protein